MTSHFLLPALLLLSLQTGIFAQTTPSVPPVKVDSTTGFSIHYDILRRVDGQNVRIVVVTAGNGPEDNAAPETPSTISQDQTAYVSATGAVLTEPKMPMPKMWMEKKKEDTQKEEKEDGDVKEEHIIVRPVQETFSMNFTQGTLVRSMTSEHDPEHKTYYTTEPLTTPKDWKTGKKTKKIAGFECVKATCTLDGLDYTLWYTTDLPGTFCPLSKLWPGTPGVVLALESDDQSFTATEIKNPVRVAQPVQVQAEAVPLTPEEMKAKRRSFIEKAMPGGANIRIRKN